jgi:WhiB family redox-sensing transcriptional regulator
MTSWEEAACYGADPALFDQDHERETAATKEQDEATIHRFCDGCVLKVACLEDAMANNDMDGIRGGMTEKQRRALRRGRLPSVINRNLGVAQARDSKAEDRRFRAYDSGLTDREIAAIVGCAPSTILDWRKRRGYPANHPQGAYNRSLPPPRAPITPEEHARRKDLWEKGWTDLAIGRLIGLSASAIRDWRNRNDLQANKYRRAAS